MKRHLLPIVAALYLAGCAATSGYTVFSSRNQGYINEIVESLHKKRGELHEENGQLYYKFSKIVSHNGQVIELNYYENADHGDDKLTIIVDGKERITDMHADGSLSEPMDSTAICKDDNLGRYDSLLAIIAKSE